MAFKSINPHDPAEVPGEFEEAGPYDVETAVVRAREAFFEWREQPASVRGDAPTNIAGDVEKWAESWFASPSRRSGSHLAKPAPRWREP